MRFRLQIFLLLILISGALYSQLASKRADSVESVSGENKLDTLHPLVIKWTKQLPEPVKRSFFKSRFADWYIEKMTRLDLNGRTTYRFIVNNGNLLDSDHHDSFIKTDSLDISDRGVILK